MPKLKKKDDKQKYRYSPLLIMNLTKKRGKNYQAGTQAIQIPWQIKKRTSEHSMLCHHQHAWEAQFKLRFAGGPMMAFGYLSSHQRKKNG